METKEESLRHIINELKKEYENRVKNQTDEIKAILGQEYDNLAEAFYCSDYRRIYTHVFETLQKILDENKTDEEIVEYIKKLIEKYQSKVEAQEIEAKAAIDELECVEVAFICIMNKKMYNYIIRVLEDILKEVL